MSIEIKVPAMGESVVEVTVGRIIIPSGNYVEKDQEIVELETEKVNQVVCAPESGTLTLAVQVGDKLKIGALLATLEPGSQKSEPKSTPPPSGGVRKAATDLVSPSPTPPPPQIAAPPKKKGKQMSALRREIAKRLVAVKNETAMLTTFNEVDMSAIMQIRASEKEDFQEKYGIKLGFMSFFIKATVSALKAYPDVHASIEGDEIVPFEDYDIGVAVSTDRGLLVPVLRGCDALSFSEIEKALEGYAKKAREGKIALEDLRGGSFTITNGGVFGSLLSTPILNPPQSGILGMHAIVKRPVAIQDKVEIRPMMYLALSYDHRLIDGKEAVQFLVHIKNQLEDPAKLLLEL